MHVPTPAWIFVKLPLTIKWNRLFSHLVGKWRGSAHTFPGPWNPACPQRPADPDCDRVHAGEVVLPTPWTCKGCLWNPPDTLRTVLSLKQHQSKGTAAASMPRCLCPQAKQKLQLLWLMQYGGRERACGFLFLSDFTCLEFNNGLFLIFDQNIALY